MQFLSSSPCILKHPHRLGSFQVDVPRTFSMAAMVTSHLPGFLSHTYTTAQNVQNQLINKFPRENKPAGYDPLVRKWCWKLLGKACENVQFPIQIPKAWLMGKVNEDVITTQCHPEAPKKCSL